MHSVKLVTAFTGGLSAIDFALRYEGLKYDHLIACEIDEYARKQFLKFHKEPRVFLKDVQKMKAEHLKGEVDIYCFGSPCQDLSLAGKRKGFDGDKSSLFREGARVLGEMMPKVFIFENVKGLLSSNGGDDYKEVVRTFQELGYLIASKVMNTKDFGVPQNRERVFIVGFLEEEKYHSYNFAEPEPLKTKLRDILEEEVDKKYYLSDKMIEAFTNQKYIADPYIKEPQLQQVGNIDTKGHNSLWGRVYNPDGISACLNAHGGGAGAKTGLYQVEDDSFDPFFYTEQRTDEAKKIRRENRKKGIDFSPRRAKELVPRTDGIANTITAQQGKEQLLSTASFKIRRLTPKECYRLQGVRDEDIQLVNSDTQSYRIAGNAISVNVMQKIVHQIYFAKKPSGSLF